MFRVIQMTEIDGECSFAELKNYLDRWVVDFFMTGHADEPVQEVGDMADAEDNDQTKADRR